MNSESEELVFVVRVWLQTVRYAGEWRGAILDVASGQRFYAVGTRDIADFIDARVAERTKPVP
jgi:hypothetical protein